MKTSHSVSSSLAVIIPAAGRSVRYGKPAGKLMEKLAARPVLRHSIAAFARRRDVRQIVVAAPPGDHPARVALQSDGFLTVCDGGDCRAHSVRNALEHVRPDIQWVAVHDAARPMVSQELIDRVLAAAVEHGAAVPALAAIHTIRQADGPLPAKSQGVIARDRLWTMQTPQIMRRADLLAAFSRCPLPLEQVTDDVQLLELDGKEVWLVAGEEENLKITTPMDLQTAEAIWAARKQ